MARIPIIIFLAVFADGVVAAIAAGRFRTLSPELKIFAVNTVVSFGEELGMVFLALQKINNLWIIHFSTPIEYALLVVFLSAIEPRPAFKTVMRLSIPFFFIFFLWAEFAFDSLQIYNSASRGVSAFLLILFAGLQLFRIFANSRGSLWRSAPFLLSVSILVTFAMGFTVFLTSNRLSGLPFELAVLPWQVSAFAQICADGLAGIGLVRRS
jgi:hypothetical protein